MPVFTFVVLILFAAASVFPLIKRKNRTTWGYVKASGTTLTVIFVIIAVEYFVLNVFIGIGIVVAVSILLDKSTYTKSGLISVGVMMLLAGGAAYFVFREDLQYVENYLLESDSTSLYYAVNNETVISKNSSMKIPLASTAKITIAGVFAEEVTGGNIDPQETVDMTDLDRFYLSDSDGGAHPAWRESVDGEEVTLEEVTRGMIAYSSNANTDYLLERLGIEKVNERIAVWGLNEHDPLFPFVSSLLTAEELQDELEELSLEEFSAQTIHMHEEISAGRADIREKELTLSINDQRYWSDWLPGSSVKEYNDWLYQIHSGEWADENAADYLLSLLKDGYQEPEGITKAGGKGGSTAFVLTQTLFMETEEGDLLQWSMFTDDLSFWERFKLNQNYGRFLERFIEDDDYRKKVVKQLQQ